MNEIEAKKLLSDKEWRMSHLYKIQTKDQHLITFKPNLAQQDYNARKSKKNAILKARQLGFSTNCLIDMFDETISNRNTNSAIIAHEQKKVQVLFEIIKRAYDNIPELLRPRVSFDNRNELYFPDIDSKIYVTLDTRSETVHNLHISEVAFIKNAELKMAGTLESVPKDGKITLETTANGIGGYFFEEWDNPQSEFKKFFYNWLWDEQYQEKTDLTDDQLDSIYRDLCIRYSTIPDIRKRFKLTKEQFQWYISKVIRHKELVVQEYPTTPLEAFIASGRNVFHISDLQKHKPCCALDRKWGEGLLWEYPLHDFKYVMGIDVAEGIGKDRSVIEILNAHTGEQAFEYVSDTIPPDRLGRLAVEIAKYYNNALIVPEINNHGRSTVDSMKKIYGNIYRREVMDRITQRRTSSLGWKTSGVTKPKLVDDLEAAVRDIDILIHSEELIKEMKIFVQTDEQGKQGYGAEGSAHDDRVIAIGLALQGIKWTPRAPKAQTIAQKKLEDYIKKNGRVPDIFNKAKQESTTDIRRKKYFIRTK